MRILILDFYVTIGVLAVFIGAYYWLKNFFENDPIWRGQQNWNKVCADAPSEQCCLECRKSINPQSDLFIGTRKSGAWFHRECAKFI